jgi:hypothetical protein
MDLENVLLAVSVVATAIPVVKLIRTFLTEVRSSKLVVTDHDGKVMGEISTERLQHTDLEELERLHERVRRDKGAELRAA